jgi:DNA-binding CsgD family transcriptional regulator
VVVTRLAGSDYRKAFEVLHVAGEVDGSLAFPEPVLQTLRELIPCDVVTFHERSNDPDRVLVYTGEPLGEVTEEIRAANRRLRHEEPMRPAVGSRMLSDFISLRELQRRELYQRVYRPLGAEHMLQLYLEPEATDTRLEFDRADSDFRARDRNVLDLLLPHLRQFLRGARRRPSAHDEVAGVTPREREVISYVARGHTNAEVARLLGISAETVRKHLENTYAKLGVHTRTAAVAALDARTFRSKV